MALVLVARAGDPQALKATLAARVSGASLELQRAADLAAVRGAKGASNPFGTNEIALLLPGGGALTEANAIAGYLGACAAAAPTTRRPRGDAAPMRRDPARRSPAAIGRAASAAGRLLRSRRCRRRRRRRRARCLPDAAGAARAGGRARCSAGLAAPHPDRSSPLRPFLRATQAATR